MAELGREVLLQKLFFFLLTVRNTFTSAQVDGLSSIAL